MKTVLLFFVIIFSLGCEKNKEDKMLSRGLKLKQKYLSEINIESLNEWAKDVFQDSSINEEVTFLGIDKYPSNKVLPNPTYISVYKRNDDTKIVVEMAGSHTKETIIIYPNDSEIYKKDVLWLAPNIKLRVN